MSQVIALVDDDRNILTSISIALQAEGFITRVYSDGDTALKAFAENPPDLGVFDIKMPRMDGMELLRRLRQQTDMPVIFLTSKDEEIDELFGLKMGADDFIRKPFSQRLLVERVKAILRRSAPKDGSVPKETDTAKVLALDGEQFSALRVLGNNEAADYFCLYHPGMKGRVRVRAKSSSVPSARAHAKLVKDQVARALPTLKKSQKVKPPASTIYLGVAGKGGVERLVMSPATATVRAAKAQ